MQVNRMKVSRALLMVGVLAVLSSSPNAEAESLGEGQVREIGGGYQLSFVKNQLRVKKGKRSAVLPGPTSHVDVEASASSVKLGYMPTCTDVEDTYSHAQLAARLDQEEGASLLRKGKAAAAEKLLASAAALDPGYERAVLDHATALVKLSRPDDAIAALAAMVKRNPMDVYFKLAADRQLASLLGRPGLAHLRAATPGTVKIDPASLALSTVEPARAPGGELAFIDVIGTTASCGADVELVIRSKDLGTLAVLPLSDVGDHDQDSEACQRGESTFTKAATTRIRKQVAMANQALAALGFVPMALDPLKAQEEKRPGVHTLRLASGKTVVFGSDGAVRLFQNAKLLSERPPGSYSFSSMTFRSAVLVPSEQRLLLTERFLGCYHQESVHVSALSLK